MSPGPPQVTPTLDTMHPKSYNLRVNFIILVFNEAWTVLLESAPFVLFGFFVAGLLKAFVPDSLLRKHLSGRGVWPVIKASLIGIPIPLCSCGVVPAASGLRSGGASKGAAAAFMISTPETGVDSIAVNYALLDPIMTVVRPIAALFIGVATGVAINALDAGDSPPPPDVAASTASTRCGCSCGCPTAPAPYAAGVSAAAPDIPAAMANPVLSPESLIIPGGMPPDALVGMKGIAPSGDLPGLHEAHDAETPGRLDCSHTPGGPQTILVRLRGGLEYAFGDMLADVGTWLLLGILLAGIIAALLPADALDNLGPGLGSMLVMLVVSGPVYVCATATTPLVAALALKGLSPGAAMVFLLAGPATNLASLTVISRMLGLRTTAVYLTTIVICSLGFGLAVNALYGALGLDVSRWLSTPAEESSGLFSTLCAIFLVVLIAWQRLKPRPEPAT